jgi:hypothetical protein
MSGTESGAERAAPTGRGFPLTDTQQAYLVGRGDLYPLGNISTHAYLELEGPLDVGRFVRAWRLLVDRHPMLRTVVDPERQEQRTLAEVPDPPIEVVDLRERPPAEVAAVLAGLRERLSHEVRPAGEWPLFSVAVALLGAGVCRVHVGFDGLTVDWASWHVMYRDLSASYESVAGPSQGTSRRTCAGPRRSLTPRRRGRRRSSGSGGCRSFPDRPNCRCGSPRRRSRGRGSSAARRCSTPTRGRGCGGAPPTRA